MKNKLLIILLSIAFSATVFTSCHKALGLQPLDRLTDQQLWQDQGLVTLYVNNFYAQLRSGFGTTNAFGNGTYLISCLTDDAVTANTSTASNAARSLVTNAYTASTTGLFSNTLWTSRYTYIRRANVFFDNIDNVPGDPQLNIRLKAEMKFLRAYYYFDLVSTFGGVPIIDKAQDPATDSIFLPRNTVAECYNFIMKDLDSAALYLPTAYPASDLGRITKQAAWGLKCRVQMLQQNWTAAAATAQAIMNLGANSLLSSYNNVFTTANNAEMILSVQHDNSKDELGTNYDKNTWTPYYGGSGNNCPTQNLVDDYEMQATGLAITAPTSGYDPNHPYKGRDPRFAATILYDSAVFKGTPMQMYTGGKDITVNAAIGVSANAITPTGYYLAKFTNQNVNVLDPNARSFYNWPIIRYAEILLNYAESQNEAVGPDASVYNAVNAIRKRAGMPNVAAGLTQAQMRTVIRHERRIELAFEDFRYYDVMRWAKVDGTPLAETLFSNATNPIKKITITINPATGARTSYVVSPLTGYNSVFTAKNYVFPIPVTEVSMPGSQLVQNPGW